MDWISLALGLLIFLCGFSVGTIWCHKTLEESLEALENAKRLQDDTWQLITKLLFPTKISHDQPERPKEILRKSSH
jgi:hypothetical protein